MIFPLQLCIKYSYLIQLICTVAWLQLEMDGLTEKKKRLFFSFIFTSWNSIEIFYGIEIVRFSVISTFFTISKETLMKKTFRMVRVFANGQEILFYLERLFSFHSSHISILLIGPEIHEKLCVERTKLQIRQSWTKSDIDWKCYHYARKWIAFLEIKNTKLITEKPSRKPRYQGKKL